MRHPPTPGSWLAYSQRQAMMGQCKKEVVKKGKYCELC